MEYRLRVYEVKQGEMAAWIDEWTRLVRPLRERLGFRVLGAWASEEDNTFVWLLGYDGRDGYEAADAAYYASPDRAALDPDPARHLATTRQLAVTPVD
jgi:NIPSNAP